MSKPSKQEIDHFISNNKGKITYNESVIVNNNYGDTIKVIKKCTLCDCIKKFISLLPFINLS